MDIKFNPQLIRWAREYLRLSVEDAAKKMSFKDTEKWNEIESGKRLLTKKQAEKLAQTLNRPFLFFYLPSPPNESLPELGFRKTIADYGTSTIKLIDELREKQIWISDVYQEERESRLPFVGEFHGRRENDAIAKSICDTLALDKTILRERLHLLIDHIQSYGIFVARGQTLADGRTPIDENIRGIVLINEYAPFIFINTKFSENVQRFTLMHELAHIWLGESTLDDLAFYDWDASNFPQIETQCNEIAAEILMPADEIKKIGATTDAKMLASYAAKFAVSKWALAYRQYLLKEITLIQYREIKQTIDDEYKAAPKNKESGGGNYYNTFFPKHSRRFVKELYARYMSNQVSAAVCMRLLHKKADTWNFKKIIEHI